MFEWEGSSEQQKCFRTYYENEIIFRLNLKVSFNGVFYGTKRDSIDK